ncbi:MAG TPA: hypothetical protein VE465_13965 [Streptosporangiaceae bacterium]|nr:hypothetical protein [Streptosporangiaceae bacterium]
MTQAELRELASNQTTTDLPTAARAWGISKKTAYAMFHAGELPFPAYQLIRSIRVPTQPLVRMLLGDEAQASRTTAPLRAVRT